ncbi:MAG: hypothetical protein K2Q06_00710, partial [Parvularculaceae bacterium]|nr:hypothetical protein [Parvularculaceae bacterium]
PPGSAFQRSKPQCIIATGCARGGWSVSQSFGAAGAEIARVARDEIAPAAQLVEDAFASVARSIERDLARAAKSGELSLKSLGRAIVQDLKGVVVDTLVRKPVENLLSNAFAGLFGGGRAGGGPVARGGAYLVGEHGPDVFRPSASGRNDRASAAGPRVTIVLPGVADAESFRRSETQIAAALSRALARGERNA